MSDGPLNRAFVRLTEPAVADLEYLVRVDPQVVRWAIKKMLVLERDPLAGHPLLGDLVGWRKLTVVNRDWRVVWRVIVNDRGEHVIEIAEVWAVGARADAEVYSEIAERITALGNRPEALALSDVIARLGRAAGDLVAAVEPLNDPVPPWLAERLVKQAHLRSHDVAKLSGVEAIGIWEAFLSSPPEPQ